MLRILALSDVYKWDECTQLLDSKPDVVALAGDLISDGGAAFWHDGLEFVPEFRRERHALYERARRIRFRKCKECPICRRPKSPYDAVSRYRHVDFLFLDHLRQLEEHYTYSEAFAKVHREIHVEKFYTFLKHAGCKAVVLVIKGDHDDDFADAYDSHLIDRTPGCREISQHSYRTGGEVFLGVSYACTAYKTTSRSLVEMFPEKHGIVIAHARQRNVHLLADLAPKLIIRGHFGVGQHRVSGVPAIFTSGGHAIVDIANGRVLRVRQPRHPLRVHQRPEPYNVV